ncbi:hypothetical protein FSP39_005927 [Pinctada imbricata]|uniref:Uncharacterized protein n=1 Tax=Pinctada imbricata TaxID=66713 RepID=A0AA88YCC3_PINIB|nr:hypothetical protein FSP39_005927 [Pinctada imbricata]
MQRFASFANYDYPDTPSAFDFVKAGWYATGLGKETACFICNIKFSEWRKSLKPLDVHLQLSPECPFIKGENVEAVNVDRTVHQNVNGHANQSTRSEFESLTNGVEQINLTETNGSATCLQPHGFTDNTSSTPQNEYHVNGFSYSPYRDTPFIPPPTGDQTDNLLNGHQLNGFRHVNGDSLSNGQVSVDNPSRSSIHTEFVHDSSNGFSSRHFNGHSRSHSDRPHFGNHLQQNNNPFVPFTADIPPQIPLPLGPPAPENGHGYLLPPPISVFSTPKFPAYHPLNVRISSYQGFPSHTGQSPRVLAQAGMFYRGYSDRCSCFWCGIGLQNWSIEDDPWVEHARWSPRCQYLIDAKGEEFIALVQESYRQEDPVFPALNDDDTMIAELQSIGFSTESIQSAIKTLKSNGRNVNLHIVANFILENMLTEPQAQANENNLPKSDPPSQIGKKEEPNVVKANNALSMNNVNSPDKTNSIDENSKSIYEETTAMKEQLTCKVCMDNSVSVVFLPCGHIVVCSVCSVRLSKCPICRRYIREKVKTLMS